MNTSYRNGKALFARRVVLSAAAVLLASTFATAQGGGQATAPDAPPQHATSTPYTGDLSIFESPGRDQRMQIGRVMDLLGITTGKTVADVGGGSGWFTVRAARRVGPSGSVFSEDINPVAVKTIQERAQREHLGNVHTVLGTADDPKLEAGSVDAILLLKVYHEIAHPAVVMKELRAAMKPDARLGIIDRNGNGADHGLNRDVVIREMRADGFRLASSYDFTKTDGQDYFLIFTAER